MTDSALGNVDLTDSKPLKKLARDKFLKWRDQFNSLYSFSTKDIPFDLGEMRELGWEDKGIYDSWDDINGDQFSKKYYGLVSKVVKKGVNANGGYVSLSDAALLDGFQLKNVSPSFYADFDFKSRYVGDLSVLFAEDTNGRILDPFDGKKSIYKKVRWDTLPFARMNASQASALDWSLFNFNKGDIGELDLSLIDWDEVKTNKKSVKAFERNFSKLDQSLKSSMLRNVGDKDLSDLGSLMSTKMLFGKGVSRKLERNCRFELTIRGKDYVVVGQAMDWSTANAYGKMNGFKFADMSDEGLTDFASSALGVYESSKQFTKDDTFSSQDVIALASENTDTINMLSAFGLDFKDLLIDPSPARKLINKIRDLKFEKTVGSHGEDGVDGYEFWADSGIADAQAVYDVNESRTIGLDAVDSLTRFALYQVDVSVEVEA